MGSCLGCVKYLLFIFNFALWLLGCAILSVGVWIKVDDGAGHQVQRMTEKVDEAYQINYSASGDTDLAVTISYLLIVFGLVLIIVTFIGCCGAVRENSCLLGVFAICLFVVMVALFGVGIWAYVNKDDVDAHTDELRATTDQNVERAVKLYNNDPTSKEFMDTIQLKFHCCGGNNAENDYEIDDIPDTCTLGRRCTDRYFHFIGDEIEEFLEERYTVIAGVALAVACCLALGIVLAVFLSCYIRRSSSVRVS